MKRISFIVLTGLFTILLLFVSWWITPWKNVSLATSVQRLTLAELRARADSVIVGVVTAISTRTGPNRKMVWTDYEIAVEETLLGESRENPRVISFAGGQDGNLEIWLDGMPRLEVGRCYVLFLLAHANYESATVGWWQGIFTLEDIEGASGSQTVLLSYNNEPLELDGDGNLFRIFIVGLFAFYSLLFQYSSYSSHQQQLNMVDFVFAEDSRILL